MPAPSDKFTPRTICINDAVALYSVSRPTLYRLMRRGKLAFTQVDGRRRLSVKELDALFVAGVHHAQ